MNNGKVIEMYNFLLNQNVGWDTQIRENQNEFSDKAKCLETSTFFPCRLKSEIDRLFVELIVVHPEFSGYKSDGPVRKLEMLAKHWRSPRLVYIW